MPLILSHRELNYLEDTEQHKCTEHAKDRLMPREAGLQNPPKRDDTVLADEDMPFWLLRLTNPL